MKTADRCILIDLNRTPLGFAIDTEARADALLQLGLACQKAGAFLDRTSLFFPKVFLNDGLAEHCDLANRLRSLKSTLRVIG